jgi:EAL domain-containing protein (putative c-di-GMP-specific phosphodiesterase class I)/FixJ family two-component response regulator
MTPSLLLVEDHAFQRSLALRLLHAQGIDDVIEAADGHEALAKLAARGAPVDIALVDLDLPGMDGIELIRLLAEHRHAHAVALCSAMDPAVQHTVSLVATASGLRMLGIHEKPLTPEKITRLLASFHAVSPRENNADAELQSDDAVRAAFADGRIRAWFQPQVEMANGQVVGVESLARWVEPDRRIVATSCFVPVLERLGLTDALTRMTLRQLAAQWPEWLAQGHRLRVSINVSAADLVDHRVADDYAALAQRAGIPPECLVFEVTESAILSDAAQGLAALARLRLKGFGLSIDDFGTGYSSMSQLAQIPFTELKIDRSYVSGADGDRKKAAMIAATLDLARRLGLDVVAEGVETAEEWQLLAAQGCALAQGWLVAKAVPAEALADAIAHWRRVRRTAP